MENIILKITNILKSRFFKFGSIVLVGSFLVSILNYVFNLTMGRMMESAEFGEVASLMGLAMIVGVPSASLNRLMSKYSAHFKEKGQYRLISQLFSLVSKYGFQLGLLAIIIFLIFTPVLIWFLRIDILPLVIYSLILPLSLLSSINVGALQGLHQFVYSSFTTFLNTFLKLFLSILFVWMGFSVAGVMAALVIGSFVSYLYSLRLIRPRIHRQQITEEVSEQINTKEVISYAKAVFWTSLWLVLLTNVDIVLAKHYLSAYLAGQYAVLSLTGKIIFYGSGAFLTVMFPMVSSSLSSGDGKCKDILKIAFLLNGVIAGGILILFLFFPTLSVKLLFGAKYLTVTPFLVWYSLAMFCCAFSQVFITYFMATHTKNYLTSLATAIFLQIILIIFFHANLLQITLSVLISNSLLLILMILVYIKNNHRQKQESVVAVNI